MVKMKIEIKGCVRGMINIDKLEEYLIDTYGFDLTNEEDKKNLELSISNVLRNIKKIEKRGSVICALVPCEICPIGALMSKLMELGILER